jgi:hypothetical protein
MPQIRRRLKFTEPTNAFEKQLEEEFLSAWQEVSAIINKGIRSEDNFDAIIVNVTDTGNADTQFDVTHSLGRVPAGYRVVFIDKGAVIYDAGAPWDVTKIYLASTVANCNVKIEVF